jgi:restriction system protein
MDGKAIAGQRRSVASDQFVPCADMPEITRQRQGEMVRKAFEILLEHPEGLPAKQVLAAVADQLTLSPFEASDYPNRPGVRRFEKILRFSTIPFVKAGWLAKTKGTWVVTDEGRAVYETHQDAAEFMRAAVALYQEWKRGRPIEQTDDVSADISEEAEEDIAATVTFEEAEEAAWADISAHLRAMSPYEFQDLVAALLEAMGYHVAWVAPPGPDRGIDIMAGLDPLGIKDPRIKVQVKHRPDTRTASDQLRSFMAVLSDKDVGIFVASGGFTRDSEAEARTQETRRITLIDLERLVELWVEHYGRIPDTHRQLLPLRPVHYLSVAT